MPWLVGTELIHSLAVTDKRGLFKSWTLLLAILAFSLSLLGTFLVRSGVLVSVHSFAADPKRGIFILAFLILMIGGALSLYAWRAPKLRSQAGFELGARESFLLFNNILLVLAPVGASVGVWIIASSLVDPVDRWRRKLTLSRAVTGMTIAHIGLGLCVIALTTVQSFTIERDVSLAQGGRVTVGAYEYRFDG